MKIVELAIASLHYCGALLLKIQKVVYLEFLRQTRNGQGCRIFKFSKKCAEFDNASVADCIIILKDSSVMRIVKFLQRSKTRLRTEYRAMVVPDRVFIKQPA